MSDKVELIAAAQVIVSSGPPGSVTFNSNHGFKDDATYAGLGVYDLELEHEHGPKKLVVQVTKNSAASGNVNIEASVLNERHIQVNNFDSSGVPADASFFISILRVRD